MTLAIKNTDRKFKEQTAVSTATKLNPNMSGQFEDVPKPSKTMDKIQKGKDGKFKLMSEAEFQKASSDEDEEEEELLDLDDIDIDGNTLALQPVTSEPNTVSEFHASALESATIQGEILNKPEVPMFTKVLTKKGRRGKKKKSICETGRNVLSNFGIGSPAPEQFSSSEDGSSKCSDSSNRFAALAEDNDVTDVTDDVIKDVPNVEDLTSSPTLDQDDNQSTKSEQDASDGASSLLLLSQDAQPATLEESKQDFQEAGLD
jgi:hypothetical protein